jgi:uncharacterized membrane protein YdjX (TVP38/TMEM64 family)
MNRPDETGGNGLSGRFSVARVSVIAVLIAGTMAGGYLVTASRDPIVELRDGMDRAGRAGPALFVVSFLALNTLGVPLPVLGAAAGVAFGPLFGTTSLIAAMTITACAQFLLARYVAGARVRQRFGHGLARVNALLRRRGALAVAGARLLPGPFSEFNMLAGLTQLTLRDFTIGTVVGCAPKALAWSGVGAFFF